MAIGGSSPIQASLASTFRKLLVTSILHLSLAVVVRSNLCQPGGLDLRDSAHEFFAGLHQLMVDDPLGSDLQSSAQDQDHSLTFGSHANSFA